ncbi:signal transduction histidine kinase [Herbihabitans rhizosphaerae]|uniref:histidine kinase n=1 Tax=Herbihabitans rhizosphaerae TaxID=1872711 RepID=A0A4Q7KPJ2_9PSEU|nr:signal transduction histidine kinase [Herbihabitans rhizosphaerae]
MVKWRSRAGSVLPDALLTVLVAFVGVVGTTVLDQSSTAVTKVDALTYVLVLASAASVAVRRRWPLGTLAVTTAALATYLYIGYPYGPIFFPFLVAVYTAARWIPLRTAVIGSVIALVVVFPHIFTHGASIPGGFAILPITAWVAVPFAIGITVRVTREATQRARAELVRKGVYDERMRVAQEVHDVVGHGLAAIKMQADVALHLLAKKPEQAETALTAISRTSSEALDELRTTLALVRRPEGEARAATPSLRRLDELRQRMDKAGVTIRLDTTGTEEPLPDAADMAGYRVVQESLTNVLRHSDAKVATVRIGYEPEAVTITVSNPAPGARAGRDGGLGIPGMRDRVASVGGTFFAGPTEDGRFEVHAMLPVNGAAR